MKLSTLCGAIAAAGHIDLANGLVKWTPEMSKSTYNELLKVIDIIPNGKRITRRSAHHQTRRTGARNQSAESQQRKRR
jgi:hypothetical protein